MLELFIYIPLVINLICVPLVQGGGLLLDLAKKAMMTGNNTEVDEAIRSTIKWAYSIYQIKPVMECSISIRYHKGRLYRANLLNNKYMIHPPL